MTSERVIGGILNRRLCGHPVYIWLLWTGAAVVLAACPMMLSDPAMWPYLLDPELLALVVVIGVQCLHLEIDLLRARLAHVLKTRTVKRLKRTST